VTLRAQVPFGFALEGKYCPSGAVTVQYDASARRILFSAEGGCTRLFLPPSVHNGLSADAAGASLLFHRYGNTYYLRGVESVVGDLRWDLPPTRDEKLRMKDNRLEVARVPLDHAIAR
jgi:hypothetical protein